ncbi:hypothetical protein Btru_055224 [Bulinus truncatus]|nr:hypothetical protein Btru_055224 [Bulinus truncatus]
MKLFPLTTLGFWLFVCFIWIKLCLGNINTFGPDGNYMCHCKNLTPCSPNGACRDGCQPGWFGPECQYEDMVQYSEGFKTYSRCFNENAVHFKWNFTFIFTWMRITLEEPSQKDNLKVNFKNTAVNAACDVIITVIDEKTYDVHCNKDLLINEVSVATRDQKNICNVFVSGGRNVAFNQSTNQTSTYDKYSSNLAVDGKRNAAFNDGSCTHTNTGLTQNPIWTVQFKKLFSVNRYVLFNRIGNQYRLSKFQLRSYNTENQPVFEYIDKGPVSGNWRYIVTSNKTEPVQTVTITNNHHEYLQTLCEVEIYGETQFCDLGKYGRDCEKFCNCFNQSETCLVSTGGCPSGCAAGFTGEGCNTSCKLGKYGVDCVFSCSNFCLTGTCEMITGECSKGCIDGYKSKYCNETCDIGSYGSNCKLNCSVNCKIETCSTTNGTCQCNPGFKGDKCEEECEPKHYGDGCQYNCSGNCLNESCDNRNGHCKGCVAGRDTELTQQ